jgi:hypothetical protein
VLLPESNWHAGPDHETSESDLVRAGCALVSLGSAAIHFAVTEAHFHEFWLFGVFFASVAWLQMVWAVGIIAVPTRRLCLSGMIGSLVLVGLWINSRTVGIPIGPQPWTPERVGFADVLSTIFEVLVIVGCGALLWSEALERAPSAWRWFASVLLGLGITAATTAAIVMSGGHQRMPMLP